MFDDQRLRLGYQAALRAARKRPAPSVPASAREPKVLVVMPSDEEHQRLAWPFVLALDLPRTRLTPVVATARVAYAPDRFAGNVKTLDEKKRDWRMLPSKGAALLWKAQPSLALDLSPEFDLAAAYVVGASPALVRVGIYSERGEPFYDFLVAPKGGYREALNALRGYLTAVRPVALSFTD